MAFRAMLVAGALLAAAALAAAQSGGDASTISVDPNSGLFLDAAGRVRLFRGVNVVYKEPPFYPQLDGFDVQNSLSDEDMANLQAWGFNVIRLGVMWSAVEPVQGAPNMTYLGIMRGLADKLATYDIFTLVDAHQDDLSPMFCGEGFPDWAIQTNGTQDNVLTRFPSPLPWDVYTNGSTLPDLNKCQQHQFAEFQATFAVNAAWWSFYRMPSLAQAFGQHWANVAKVFRGSKALLGYELLNEPWFGDAFKDPLQVLETGASDNQNLLPLYRTVMQSIRQVDNDTIVFYEPSVATGFLNQPFGFTQGPGADNSKQAVAFHVYCFNQNATGDITDAAQCNSRLQSVFNTSMNSVRAVGGGSMLTEFGAVGPHQSSADTLSYMGDLADHSLQSWTYWSFKHYQDITTQNPVSETFYNADGSLQMLKLQALSRTYARAIAGVPNSIHMSFNASTAAFDLYYIYNAHATLPTEIYLNEALHYPNGFNAVVTPKADMTLLHPENNTILVLPTPQATGPLMVHVTITPK